jgi:hypothetical protein
MRGRAEAARERFEHTAAAALNGGRRRRPNRRRQGRAGLHELGVSGPRHIGPGAQASERSRMMLSSSGENRD